MPYLSYGIEPSAAMGYGVGEYVAACVAGVFSLEDSLKLIAAKSQVRDTLARVLDNFEAVTQEVSYHKPQIQLISNVTGEVATEIATSEYWCRHVREPVRFAEGIKTLHQAGYGIFVEIGLTPTLLEMGYQCLPEGVGVWLPSLYPGQEDWQQILESSLQLYMQGVSVDWLGFDRDYPRRQVVLPTYPFQRQRYWIETS